MKGREEGAAFALSPEPRSRGGCLLRRRCCRHLWRGDGGVGRRSPTGLIRTTGLTLLLLGLGGLVGELHLALTELLHHRAPGFLVFGVVHRRAVIGLGEAG